MKLNFTRKRIFQYLYAVLFLANCAGLFYVWQFANKHVYGSLLLDKQEIMTRVPKKISDLNENKFNTINKKQALKKQRPDPQNIANPFD